MSVKIENDVITTGLFSDRRRHNWSNIQYSLGNGINEMSDISKFGKENVILEGKYSKVLVVRYPYRSRNVYVRCSLSVYFIFGLIGLSRRVVLGTKRLNSTIRLRGFVWIKQLNGYYLQIENQNSLVPTQFSLDERIGYKGFLDFLRSTGLDYVVIRFFEKLPEIRREGGDLDVVVDDGLLELASNFLRSNPGNLLVDLYGVTTPANGAMLPYYPPWFMREIFEHSVTHKSGYRVPSETYYLDSFIYHCIYHKGYSSGIQSERFVSNYKKDPDNDYEGYTRELLRKNNIDCPDILTLEWLDNYLEKRGVKPHSDTLAFIALTNPWLAQLLQHSLINEEIGVSVLVLKEGVVNKVDDVIAVIESEGFKVLRKESLSGELYGKVVNRLRGGNWFSNGCDKVLFNPQVLLIITDNDAYSIYKIKKGLYQPRIRGLKTSLRQKFDEHGESYFHATDNSLQASEYLNELYGKEYYNTLKTTLDAQVQSFNINRLNKSLFFIKSGSSIFLKGYKNFKLSTFDLIRRFV